eukprot:gene5581-9397_t
MNTIRREKEIDNEFWERYLNSQFYEEDELSLLKQNSPLVDLDLPTMTNKEQTFSGMSDKEKSFERALEESQKNDPAPRVKRIVKQRKSSTTDTSFQPVLFNLTFDMTDYTNSKTSPRQRTPPTPSNEPINSGPWSVDETERFIQGFNELGKRWKQISTHFVKTRNSVQVTSYGQKYLKKHE